MSVLIDPEEPMLHYPDGGYLPGRIAWSVTRLGGTATVTLKDTATDDILAVPCSTPAERESILAFALALRDIGEDF